MIRNTVLNTNTANGKPFEHTDLTVDHVGEQHTASFRYTVNGFWSADQIAVQIVRKETPEGVHWTPSLAWSSGGRDTTTVPSDSDAAKNFAAALNAAADFTRMLSSREDAFEARYQQHKEFISIQDEVVARHEQDVVEMDKPMSVDKAQALFDTIHDSKDPEAKEIKVRIRGKDMYQVYVAKHTPHGRVTIRKNGERVPAREFITQLTGLSSDYIVQPAVH